MWEINITMMEYVSALLEGQTKGMRPLALFGSTGRSFTKEVIFELSLRKKSVSGKKNHLKNALFGGSGRYSEWLFTSRLYLDSGPQKISSK